MGSNSIFQLFRKSERLHNVHNTLWCGGTIVKDAREGEVERVLQIG